MKMQTVLLMGFILLTFFSCSKEDEILIININGKAQKGPLLSGSVVTLSEIDQNLVQTGKVYTANISDDNGSFKLDSIELVSPYALLTANGFYYNEVSGKLSPTQITLQAYVDLTDKESVNVNILTHLTKQRIEVLVNEGKELKVAKKQAELEFLKFIGQDAALDNEFEDLDISQSDDQNAILLAFSIISQRYSSKWGEDAYSTAELSELLKKISDDFLSDGLISDQKIIDTLMYNIGQIYLPDVRENVENRYKSEENLSVIPDFEKYVTLFQKKHSKLVYTEFEFPVQASPFPYMSPGGVIDNLLHESKTGKIACKPYSIAAMVPFDKKLRITITVHSGEGFLRGGPDTGWTTSFTREPLVFTYESQRCNMLLSALVTLESSGSATIQFFENESITPFLKKEISW